MNMKHIIAGLIVFSLLARISYSQTPAEAEEIKVINDLLYIMTDAERLIKFNKTIVYFDLKMDCNLNGTIHGDYKTNKLIKRLKNNVIDTRLIDSTQIVKNKDIQLVFNKIVDYEHMDYLSNKIIGTLKVSRVSFNKSLNIGYLYYSLYCGGDCGWGNLVKIEKIKGTWTITKYLISYVA
jgi:hypothetical protein